MSAIIIKNALIRLNATTSPELTEQLTAQDFVSYAGILNYYGGISRETAAMSIENLDILPDAVIAMLQDEGFVKVSIDAIQAATTGNVDIAALYVPPADTEKFAEVEASLEADSIAIDAQEGHPADPVLDTIVPLTDATVPPVIDSPAPPVDTTTDTTATATPPTETTPSTDAAATTTPPTDTTATATPPTDTPTPTPAV